jgi:hypothetical protein
MKPLAPGSPTEVRGLNWAGLVVLASVLWLTACGSSASDAPYATSATSACLKERPAGSNS